jgi:hypothetical protein
MRLRRMDRDHRWPWEGVSWIGKNVYLHFIGGELLLAVCNRHHFYSPFRRHSPTFLDDWSVPVNVLILNRQLIGYDRDVHYVGDFLQEPVNSKTYVF